MHIHQGVHSRALIEILDVPHPQKCGTFFMYVESLISKGNKFDNEVLIIL